MAAAGASSISVTVRVRPFTINEAAQLRKTDDGPLFLGDGSLAGAPAPKLQTKGIRSVIKVVDDKCLVFDPPEDNPVQRFSRTVLPQGKRVKDQTFVFDRVFDENTTQPEVFEGTAKPLVDNVFDGYNATVFAYGATGCGKTHTITGISADPGIIFLTMQDIFEKINELQSEKVTELSLSYLEIYNETIRDLLAPDNTGNKAGLTLREDAHQAVSVQGLSSYHPTSVEEVMNMIIRGNDLRTVNATAANATSSRSHAVLQINISTKDRNADINEPHTMATLSIIDLAGSERASATKNRGERLVEGANINKSLLALGSCINALCQKGSRAHIPYRNSKLTRLLKFSLGGNCKTVMIVCVSPSSIHFDETQNTLRYANRAKNIQTKVTRNVYNVNRHVKDFLKKIDEQMALINELKQQQKEYESVAYVKFQKQSEKREDIAREGIARIRSAYENSAPERQEKINLMKRLRQIERRISLISAWIAGFDVVTQRREEEVPPKGMETMRKTAQGILVELEASRHHYRQRIDKNNWERPMDSALQNALRQLKETDAVEDGSDIASLMRETELLRSIADRESYVALLDQEKGGDATIVQVLLQAHFDTIAIINQILQMDEQDAIQAAKNVLLKMITSCSEATSQVIKPDGGLPVTDMLPPIKAGTPKKRKPVTVMAPSPVVNRPRLSAVERVTMTEAPATTQGGSSPLKGSPRRRKMGGVRKGINVQFTPKKKSPSKKKAGVRWKDEHEEGGKLVDFQVTPEPIAMTPDQSENQPPIPPMPCMLGPDVQGSSPIPAPPEPSMDAKPRSSRFQTGFLSKPREAGSPAPPTFTNPALMKMDSSDSEGSPLREMEANRASHRSNLHLIHNVSSTDNTPFDSAASGSDSEKEQRHKGEYELGPVDVAKVRTSLQGRMKRTSSGGNSRTARRRSPTAATSGSPPPEGSMFTAGQVRRMVKSEREGEHKRSVLSPHTNPVVKGSVRRTTLQSGPEDRRVAVVRVPSAARSSVAGGSKSTWR